MNATFMNEIGRWQADVAYYASGWRWACIEGAVVEVAKRHFLRPVEVAHGCRRMGARKVAPLQMRRKLRSEMPLAVVDERQVSDEPRTITRELHARRRAAMEELRNAHLELMWLAWDRRRLAEAQLHVRMGSSRATMVAGRVGAVMQ